jgi:DUF1680 family protein
MLKLTRKLYEWNPDPRLFDFYERALFNHRLGTINSDGQTQYYLGVVPGSWRAFATKYDSFWCCTGTGTEEYAKLNDSIYFHDADGIFVNLFIASELHWAERNFRLRQETRFPEEGRTTLIIDAEEPEALTLRVRIPQWASHASVKINGKLSDVSATPGSYLAIARTWTKGDRVEVDLPMSLHSEWMADDHSLRAFLYGPLVLAGKLGREGLTPALEIGPEGPEIGKAPALEVPQFAANNKRLDEWIKPGDRALTFKTSEQSVNVAMEPFYKVNGERYSLYWKVS